MWNYRVIKFKDKESDDVTYGLYETFYNDDGDIFAHAELPDVVGETLQEIGDTLRMMQSDYKKHRKDPLLVLAGDDIKFAPMSDDESEEPIPFDIS